MPAPGPTGYAFNRTRQVYLATELAIARTHWSRLRGLIGKNQASFGTGHGLWIVPSQGVHTFAMPFPIDVVYLDRRRVVLYLETSLKPWRVAPVRLSAASVLELPCNTLNSTGTSLGDEIEIGENGKGEDNPA
jgi:uncharacterized membrane protein (UPF0127 family)